MRNASTLVRLLLFALLLIGTVGMHTIGHPPEAQAAAAAMPAEAAADISAATGTTGDCPGGHCASGAGMQPAAAHPAGDSTHSPSGQGGHGSGMDPASLCLAIALAAFVLAVTWFALRRGTRRRAAARRGLWGRLSSALPPPQPPDLSRLSALRI